jgi:ubiquinone/menaquinone biosynthesis C-methylase UbiE
MPDHDSIYKTQADQYDLLVSREDYEGNILRTLRSIKRLEGLDVIELGAGTGRLSTMLAPLVKSMQLFDISQHMLEVAAGKLAQRGLQNWRTHVADHRSIPAEDHSADLVISGWSICYAVVENEETRPEVLATILGEMKRVLRPGGMIMILETMGTGHHIPTPPPFLVPYYHLLREHGFSTQWIRTDYRFESLGEAESVSRFFFGDELADRVVRENWRTLPECTGIWWLQLSQTTDGS